MSASLQHALEALYGLERRRDKHDLLGTSALLAALGDPHHKFRSVHVAGTNGKGSVCALIERVLREAGVRTGLFTSPHLVDFRERIRVCGRWADETWLQDRIDHIANLPAGRDCTFFEACTALAFDYFAQQGVEIAVVEVGLGGRLDCTNVITPLVSVITTIGLDHTDILGDTIEKIAAEKAGIIKPGVPVVTFVEDEAARGVIDEAARKTGAPVVGEPLSALDHPPDASPHRLAANLPPDFIALNQQGGMMPDAKFRFRTPWGERVELPEVRRLGFIEINRELALATLGELVRLGVSIPWQAVSRGLAEARWPGRLERCPNEPRLWWDGAHNLEGMRKLSSLASNLGGAGRPGAIVLALSGDKDVRGIADVLHRDFGDAVIVATRFQGGRSLAPAAILEAAHNIGFTAVEAADVPRGVHRALELAGTRPVLLTGSLFAVGEAMVVFGGAPGEML